MKWNLPVLSFLLAIMLAIGPAIVQAQPLANVTEGTAVHRVSEQRVDTTDTAQHPIRNSTVGCATGAVLGTVVPGLGNLVGCMVGGFIGWWVS